MEDFDRAMRKFDLWLKPSYPIENFGMHVIDTYLRLHQRARDARGETTLVDFHKEKLGPPTGKLKSNFYWDMSTYRLWVGNVLGISLEAFNMSPDVSSIVRDYELAVYGSEE